MPLLHFQFGPCAEAGLQRPVAGSVHMLCAPAGDSLSKELLAYGIKPTASASVIHHRMGLGMGTRGLNWNFILTSDI
jgi:hypothetical protein